MGETMMKDRIHTITIKIIIDEKVARGLVLNSSSIIMSKMGGELLGSQICENISVPRIIHSDDKQVFIGELIINQWITCPSG